MRKKNTVESVNAFVAEIHGGACNNIKYIRDASGKNVSFGVFQCADGHEWTAQIDAVINKKRSWCRACIKHNINDANKLANTRGGTCLSAVMKNSKELLEWQCGKGHRWNASYSNVNLCNSWCPICAVDAKRNTDQDASKIAMSHGGKCLSKYIDAGTKMEWECAEGHKWFAKYCNVANNGSWCKKCVINDQKLTQEHVDNFAISKGGKCLSKYNDAITPMEWECEFKHVWTSTLSYLKRGENWCSVCISEARQLNQLDVNKFAISKGGKCLSVYVDIHSFMSWECKNGHVWNATFKYLKYTKRWCNKCSDTKQKYKQQQTLAALNYAKLKGGKCHSEYTKSHSNMTWECKHEHTWNASFNNIKNKEEWCPHCSNKSESECREIFEQLFGAPFPNTRPEWLRNPEGNKLELDGYNEALKVAWEFNGIQHYEVADWHGGTEEKLKKQQLHDAIKVRECAKRGIDLIVISYKLEKWKDKLDYIYTMLYSMYPQVQDRLEPLWR